jgi:hypothetical protein
VENLPRPAVREVFSGFPDRWLRVSCPFHALMRRINGSPIGTTASPSRIRIAKLSSAGLQIPRSVLSSAL